MTYLLTLEGLEQAIADALPSKEHGKLLDAVRSVAPQWTGLRVVAVREGGRWDRRKVIDKLGTVLSDDHKGWLQAQLDLDGGHLGTTQRRLQALDLRLSECAVSHLYLVHDRSGDPSDFVQIEIYQENEICDRRLFSVYGSGYLSPRDLRDLVEAAEQGEELPAAERLALGPTRYRLGRAVDVQRFVQEASGVEGTRHAIQRQRYIMVTEVTAHKTSEPKPVRIGDLDPDALSYAWQGQRLMDDWAASSAGLSGARFCHHWALQLSDYTDGKQQRWMGLVPVWAHRQKIAQLRKRPPSDSALLEKLRSLDRRTGAPFAWYFYMLHGNLVEPWAGEVIAAAARMEIVDLPAHDLAVLNRWVERPYGF